MLWSGIFAATALLHSNSARATVDLSTDQQVESRFTLKAVEKRAEAMPLEVSKNIIALEAVEAEPKSSAGTPTPLSLRHANGPSTASSSLQFVTHHMSYAIKIDVGDRAYNVIFDTGSADLWLATEDIDCYCGEQQKIDKHMCCKFGASANGTFGQGRSDNGHIGLLYGDATAIYGPSGYDRVSVAGIEVDRQEYIMAEQAVWAHGDGVTSGIMGFSASALSRVGRPSGPGPVVDQIESTYMNWFGNAIEQNLTAPVFSLALNRLGQGNAGQLALGGVPDVKFEPRFASTPLHTIELNDVTPLESTNFTYYTIIPDGYHVQTATTGKVLHQIGPVDSPPTVDRAAIVDSGCTHNLLPPVFAKAINLAFDPPGTRIPLEMPPYGNLWTVDCQAQPPNVSVIINGVDFWIKTEDLMLPTPFEGLCVSTIQESSQKHAILGDVFLKNVVAVHDLEAGEMRFAARVDE